MPRPSVAALLIPAAAAAGVVSLACADLIGLERAARGDPTAPRPDAPDAAGCAADKSRDPRHCGSCGHDCGGGACAAGRCRPEALTDEVDNPRAIALDDARMYVAVQDVRAPGIYGCLKTGCATLAADRLAESGAFVLRLSTSLYWIDPFVRAPLCFCDPRRCRPGCRNANLYEDSLLALDGAGQVYTANMETVTHYTPDLSTFAPVYTAPQKVRGLVGGVIGPVIAWAEGDQLRIVGCQDDRCASTRDLWSGAAPATLGMAVAGGELFWTGASGLFHCALASSGAAEACRPQLFAGPDALGGLPREVWVDADGVYWTVGAALFTCPRTGCGDAPLELARTEDAAGISAVITDARSIYWLVSHEVDFLIRRGAVMRVTKP